MAAITTTTADGFSVDGRELKVEIAMLHGNNVGIFLEGVFIPKVAVTLEGLSSGYYVKDEDMFTEPFTEPRSISLSFKYTESGVRNIEDISELLKLCDSTHITVTPDQKEKIEAFFNIIGEKCD